jgi:hypothetical protein
MMEIPGPTFELTNREMWLLLCRFSPVFRIGYRNPFPGWGMQEILADRPALEASLEKKDLGEALSAPPGSIWHEILLTCAHPLQSLFVSSQFASSPQSHRVVLMGKNGSVELDYPSLMGLRLSWIRDRNLLVSRLSHGLRLDSPLTSSGESFLIKEENLNKANGAFRKGRREEGEAVMHTAGLKEAEFQRACETLQNPVSNGAVACLGNPELPDPPVARGFAVLEGRQTIWILRNHNQGGIYWTEWTPCSGSQIRSALEMLL